MSGGYIECGSFMGGDKSGSAISGVLDALPACVVPLERSTFSAEVADPIKESLSNSSELIQIQSSSAKRLISPLEIFVARVGQELGFPEPWEALEKDLHSGLDPIEAKWGKGKGWQYLSATDLLEACRVSVATGEPVCLTFD